jgi:hypothetical protein
MHSHGASHDNEPVERWQGRKLLAIEQAGARNVESPVLCPYQNVRRVLEQFMLQVVQSQGKSPLKLESGRGAAIGEPGFDSGRHAIR